MKKYIVTTTINTPTKATIAFSKMPDWTLIVVGDKKTPHEEYKKINCIYLDPDYQHQKYRKLSESIGWSTIQRRNIGFVEAYKLGADVVATVDDDNIPYKNWGENLYIGQEIECDLYEPELDVFDPLSITKSNNVWHRGFPIEYVPFRHSVEYLGKTKRKVLIQADLWDGDPDIDAIARLSFKPIVKFSEITAPYCSNKISPFNSQNTFISREVLKDYAVLPFIGRMDDIWGAYILQSKFPNSVIYNCSTVYQDRNKQDLITNLEKEVIGYRKTLEFVKNLNNYEKFLPSETKVFLKTYSESFKS
jgi:hypothetical protein